VAETKKTFLVCDCEKSMPLDFPRLKEALGEHALAEATHLCRVQIEEFERIAAQGAPLVIGCTQEALLFLETLDEMETPPEAAFVNIRERAGWSVEAVQATPKIAALLAEAALDVPDARSVRMESEGVLLILGRDQVALDAAAQLADRRDHPGRRACRHRSLRLRRLRLLRQRLPDRRRRLRPAGARVHPDQAAHASGRLS